MLNRILKLSLLLIIFLIPLIPASFGFGYELIKVVTFLCLTIASGLIFTFFLSKKKLSIAWTKIKIAALLFLVILSITSFLGVHPQESLVGKYPYFQGLILYWLLFFFSLMISSSNIKEELLIKIISLSAVIVSLISIVQFAQLNLLGMQIPTYAGRVVSTFGQPNLYSGFLLLTLPWILKDKKYWTCLIICLGIILSLSKSAIFIISGLLIYYVFKNLKPKGLMIFIVIYLLLNVLVFSLETSSGIIYDELIRPLTQKGMTDSLVEKRVYIYPIIWNIYLKNPILGFGLDSINTLYAEEFSDFKPELKNYPPLYFNLKNLIVDRSHNYFLDLLIFSGLIGFLSYLYLIYLLFKTKVSGYLKVCLILYLAWTAFQVQSVVHLIFFWLIVGLISGVQENSHVSQKEAKAH